MASHAAVRIMRSAKTPNILSVHLQCQVKPGRVSKEDSIESIDEDFIKLNVQSRAEGGQANKAVTKLIGKVSALALCKSVSLMREGTRRTTV
jgi:uncharacterized protein YggU (UPF0235/DUF167 family)